MHRFINGVKAQASAQARTIGTARVGIVQSYNPNGTARVTLQPDNVLTGWLPVVSPWGGSAWGAVGHFSGGEQVLVVMQEGNADNGVIVGRMWSDVEQTPGGVGGEWWLVHKSGSYLKFTNDGHVKIADAHGSAIELTNDGNVKLTGNLLVSGDITDLNRTGSTATLNALRNAHNNHGHPQANDSHGDAEPDTGTPTITV